MALPDCRQVWTAENTRKVLLKVLLNSDMKLRLKRGGFLTVQRAGQGFPQACSYSRCGGLAIEQRFRFKWIAERCHWQGSTSFLVIMSVLWVSQTNWFRRSCSRSSKLPSSLEVGLNGVVLRGTNPMTYIYDEYWISLNIAGHNWR